MKITLLTKWRPNKKLQIRFYETFENQGENHFQKSNLASFKTVIYGIKFSKRFGSIHWLLGKQSDCVVKYYSTYSTYSFLWDRKYAKGGKSKAAAYHIWRSTYDVNLNPTPSKVINKDNNFSNLITWLIYILYTKIKFPSSTFSCFKFTS